MIKEALEYIGKLSKPVKIEIPDSVISGNIGEIQIVRNFLLNTQTGNYVEVNPLKYTPLILSTLTGLSDILKIEEEINGVIKKESSIICIADYDDIVVFSKFYNTKDLSRELFISVKAKKNENEFQFGQYLDIEKFRIAIATFFAKSTDKDILLDSISRVESGNIVISEDDGFSQQVSAKSGIARKATVTLPKYISLAPFRSFPEISPVEEDFLFRIRKGRSDDSVIECSLHRTGSIQWKSEISKQIKKWLSEKLKGWSIVE